MRLERGLAGDIRWAVCVLAGMALAILVFGESAALLLAPAVVAEVVEAGGGTRGGEQRRLVEGYERGRRAELASEGVELGDPLRPRIGSPDHASDVARKEGRAALRQLLPTFVAAHERVGRRQEVAYLGQRYDA